MILVNIARRRFVVGLPWFFTLALAPKLGRAADGAIDHTPLLSTLARLLFPHQPISHHPYLAAARTLQKSAEKSPDLAVMINDGIASLQRMSGGDWTAQDEEKQISDMQRIEGSAFFTTAYQQMLTSIYRNPEVWKLIGYEGSSVEYGGYIDRGFNDIDWLPVE